MNPETWEGPTVVSRSGDADPFRIYREGHERAIYAITHPEEEARTCGNQALYQCILYALFAVIGACFGVIVWVTWVAQ